MSENYNKETSLLKQDQYPESPSIQKLVLKWENINFTARTDEKSTQILHNLSGFSNPQEILAIMGPSGSGKTSLLSLLSNQLIMQDNFDISGEISLNKASLKSLDSNEYIRYVPQESVLFDFLTPYQFLKFTLSLRTNYSKAQVKRRVEEIIEQLNLKGVAHSLIGNAIVRGLSGGERKRVCIAAEVMLCPSVLILDEPTSGLDSVIAKMVVKMLKDIAKTGVNVVITVHQPSYEIFQMFDKLILMQLGHFVYQGAALDSVKYFEAQGFEVPLLINPPEFYMRLLNIVDRNNLNPSENEIIEKMRSAYKECEGGIWNNIASENQDNIEVHKEKVDNGLFKTIPLLFWRESLGHYNNPLVGPIKVVQIVFFVILLDLIYNDLGYDEKGLDDRRGALSFFMSIFIFIPSAAMTFGIVGERNIVLKELKEGLYELNSYYLPKFIIEIPICIITVFILVFGTYYVIGFNDNNFGKVLTVVIISIVAHFQGVILGLFTGVLSKNALAATNIQGVVQMIFYTFAGLMVDPDCTIDAIQWFKYCTPFYYIKNAYFINEFDDLHYDDDVDPEPKDRYKYEGTIAGNTLISLVHFCALYFITYLIFRYQINKTNINN